MSLAQFLSKWYVQSPSNQVGICAVCGVEGDRHHPVDNILDTSTGKINELFSFDSNLICPCCASLWQKPKVWHRSILATCDRLAFPLIAPEGSIKKAPVSTRQRDPMQDWSDRPTWTDLIRDRQWWGQERYAILSTDGQRRAWQKTRASRGENLAIVFHDMPRAISELVTLHLPKLVKVLDAVELAYSNGYSKVAIETSLFSSPQGINKAIKYESLLRELRGSPEFTFAVVIAQKREKLIDADSEPQIQGRGFRTLEKDGDDRSPVSPQEPISTTEARRKSTDRYIQLSFLG